MQMRSEIVELQVIDQKGKVTTYFTYDGYFEKADRVKIREQHRKIDKRVFASSFITGIFSYYASKKMQMPTVSVQSRSIPVKGLLSGVMGFGVSYLLFDFIGTLQQADLEKDVALNSRYLPLWKNKMLAVNPDRAFFELIDSNNNEPCIFHSGLTPEAAAKLVPDKIIGSIPPIPLKLH